MIGGNNLMEFIWEERDKGYFYPNTLSKNSALWDKLQMLTFEDLAEEKENGVLIPFDKAVSFSPEDADFLKFPPQIPYRLSIRANGDLAHNNLKYILEIMQPDDKAFVRPKFKGALVYIGENVYRLNFDQYQLLCLTQKSNNDLAAINRREVLGYNLTNAYHIGQHANNVDAKLDNTLSEKNGKIIVADRLGVEFKEDANSVTAAPILLTEDSEGNISPIDNADIKDFQKAFDGSGSLVRSVYKGENNTRYVCSEKLQSGLKQIKAVKKLSKDDANRYIKQPKELFTEDVFALDNDEFITDNYSLRVEGIETVSGRSYSGADGRKSIDWLPSEGAVSFDAKYDDPNFKFSTSTPIETNVSEEKINNDNKNTEDKSADITNDDVNENDTNLDDISKAITEIDASPIKPIKVENSRCQLKIKTNFVEIDYTKNKSSRQIKEFSTALLPEIKLLPHQKQGVDWMLKEWEDGYQGVLLADDMGLGKTLQTLAFIGGLKNTLKDTSYALKNPVLIVAPTSLLTNWQNEYEKFLQKDTFEQIIILQGQSLKKYQTGKTTPTGKKELQLDIPSDALILTTYETLRDYQFSFAKLKWSIIIADEAQKIKNPQAGVTNAIKAMQYDFTISLSGTPVENSWVDLWSIMDFVQPACIGELQSFRQNYIKNLEKIGENKKQIEELGKKLKKSLEPLFLRRMKKDYLEDMPKKHIFSCREEMPEYQLRRYISVIKYARENEVHPLQVIAKIRDISLHPDLGTKSVNDFYNTECDVVINQSARLKKTFSILEEVKTRNEKALIFLVSRDMQDIVRHLIEEKFKLDVLPPINGEMNGKHRQKFIDKFNASEGFNVLILSPEAAGVGFTITSANNVIHLSRTWNPAKEEQATDRAYRIGQEKDVNVYYPMSCHKELGEGNSFDEKLDNLMKYKQTLSENVLFPTKDSAKDGIKMFQELNIDTKNNQNACYWNIEEVDAVIGTKFEHIIADLYKTMGYYTKKTPDTNDNGADVVAIDTIKKVGFLIQCKHTEEVSKTMGKQPIQEVTAALKAYEAEYKGVKFTPVAITNAAKFSEGARELAASNGVDLIARNELAKMFEEYEVLRV